MDELNDSHALFIITGYRLSLSPASKASIYRAEER
jgi:hypothetical protein